MNNIRKYINFLLNMYKKFIKIFVVLFIFLILIFILDYFPIVPKIYYILNDYNFSYNQQLMNESDCMEGYSWINNSKENISDLKINGVYTWTYSGSDIKNNAFGFYRIDENNVYLYVREYHSNYEVVNLIRRANAFLADKTVNFEFIIKNIPEKDYNIILNNTEKISKECLTNNIYIYYLLVY